MKITFTILFSIVAVIYARGQTSSIGNLNQINQQVIPPSPNAAALAKFGNIPVNTHTGIPKISIPIYAWKNTNSNLSLNISVDYHAGGTKVEEIASNVGLGWALNAGGIISRTVRGLPDELPNYGFLNSDTLPNANTYLYNRELLHPKALDSYSTAVWITKSNFPVDSWNVLGEVLKDNIDSQQDIFNLSCNGISCKFFISKDLSIVKVEKSNIKIIPIAGTTILSAGNVPLASFKVIAEDGTVYIFDKIEVTTTENQTVDRAANETRVFQKPYVSSWYLSEIQSVNKKDKITFAYEASGDNYNSNPTESKSFNFSDDPATEAFDAYKERSYLRSISIMKVDGLSVSSIKFPDNTTVNFTYDTQDRQDDGTNSLIKVTISNNGRSHGFQFFQDYFTAKHYTNDRLATDTELKRLRLYKIQEFGGAQNKNPYLFFYNSTSLPQRISNYQDYWGYPIGPQRNAMTLMPLTHPVDGDMDSGVQSAINAASSGTDRSPDEMYAKAAVLEKIIYPTQGSTSFEYESNNCGANNGLYFQVPQTKNITIPNTQIGQPISIDLSATINLRTRFSFKISETAPRPGDGSDGTPTTTVGGEIDTKPVKISIANAGNTWSAVIYEGTYGDCRSSANLFTYLQLPQAGIYYITIQFTPPYNQPFDANVSASIITTTDRLVGGIRIKRIIDSDPSTNSNVSIKEYRYVGDDSKSSGRFGHIPNYDYYLTSQLYNEKINAGTNTPLKFLDILTQTAEPTMPLAAVQGSPIGYERVEVKNVNYINGSDLGKTVYTYTPIEYAGFINIYPFRPGQYLDWLAGLPKSESVYDDKGQLKKSIENTWNLNYEEIKNVNNRSLKVGLIFSDSFGNASQQAYVSNAFYPYVGIAQKLKTVEKQYEGGNIINETTTYEYDPQFYTLKKLIKTGSQGDIKESRLYYPQDFTGINAFQTMVNANRLSTPVRQDEWTIKPSGNTHLSAGTAIEYKDFDMVSYPYKQYSLHNAQLVSSSSAGTFSTNSLFNSALPYELKFSFDSYDVYGNPLLFTQNATLKGAYQWGYNHQYPIAKISNASNNEFYYESYEDNLNVLSDGGHTGKNYASNSLVSWNRPNTRIYIITYWYRSGNKWLYSGEQPYTGNSYNLSGGDAYDDICIYPKDAQLITYAYDPLVGMTSQTDASGRTTYYEYDAFQRLVNVKDQDGKVLKHYDYHYQNQ